MVEEALNLGYHGARAEKTGFNVTIEKALDPAAGFGDLYLQEITRVLLNLISNGFYATTKRKLASSGRLRADAQGFHPQSRRARGNPHPRQRHRHSRGGESENVQSVLHHQARRRGTGLGLSLSHDIIVKQHGGTIEVATEPGEFSEFIIYFAARFAAREQQGASP